MLDMARYVNAESEVPFSEARGFPWGNWSFWVMLFLVPLFSD